MDIHGLPVRKLLVDEAVNIDKEIYISITNDRTAKCPVMMVSSAGGVDIEEIAQQSPEKIIRVYIDPLLGLRDYQARDMASSLDLPRNLWRPFSEVAHGLWKAYKESDADLAEINPLVITSEQRLMALDGKMILDANALYRHTDLADMRDLDAENPAEIEAHKYGLSYIKLDGQIGCMVNGAGLAMATMDIIKLYGGEPANFLDVGGGASAEKVSAAFRIILSDRNVKSVLINIFGGITRCDEVARGILAALNEVKVQVPMVVRLVGTNAEEGLHILKEANMVTAETLVEAAEKSVALAQGGTDMSILINRDTRLLVQGITGHEGLFHTEHMLQFGTNVVAGVTPGKGGDWVVDGKIPVFDSVKVAVETTGANASVIFVPARFAPDAMYEAADAGIPLIFCITEGVPVQDMMRVTSYLRAKRVTPDWSELSRCVDSREIRRSELFLVISLFPEISALSRDLAR
jgi:succinyl-CoA synthetase beta subunit